MKKTYEVLCGGEWLKVQGVIQPSGWLHWETKDGETGLTPPDKFREVQKKSRSKQKELQ